MKFKISIKILSLEITIPLQIFIYIFSSYTFFVFSVIFYKYANPNYLHTKRLLLSNKKTRFDKWNIKRIYLSDINKKTNILFIKFNKAEIYMINYCNRYIALLSNIICYILTLFNSNILCLSHFAFTSSLLYECLIFFPYLIWLLYPILKKEKSHIKSLESFEK